MIKDKNIKFEDKKEKKLRGGYYTPDQATDFITNWAVQPETKTILEPSCGDGAFLKSIFKRVKTLNSKLNKFDIQAIELNENEALKIPPEIRDNINLNIGDFFKYIYENPLQTKFDSIVGNPPFIRYQDFPDTQRAYAFQLMKEAGLKPSRLTNAWIPFLVLSATLLNENGRLGMVIPAELFQVNYAAETRRFLSREFSKIHILTFNKLIFPSIQQEVVLLLFEKKLIDKHYINISELNDISSLSNFNIPANNHSKELDHSSEKWIQYYLTGYELDLIRHIRKNSNIPLAKNFYQVDVGIVTGQNKFFVLSKNQVDEFGLNTFTSRIVGKANHLAGVIIDEQDWEKLIEKNFPNFLLTPPDGDFEKLPPEIKKYIKIGEENNYHLGYKCSIRQKWWVVPSIWKPDAFMLRQVHSFPKLVLNECSATNTDTLHRIKFLNGENQKSLIAGFTNSLTFAFSEIMGRSYGGGVLTFEPSEAENLPLPHKKSLDLDFDLVNKLLREKKIDKVLKINDESILKNGWGFSDKEIHTLNKVWQKLRDRRILRNRKSISSTDRILSQK